MRETDIITTVVIAATGAFFAFLLVVTKIAEANERGIV